VKTLTTRRQKTRRLPIGAEVTADGVDFRVWAPNAESVDVVMESPTASTHELMAEGEGYFSGVVQSARADMPETTSQNMQTRISRTDTSAIGVNRSTSTGRMPHP
jgi:1,4-alpha-glucan branching enzyme